MGSFRKATAQGSRLVLTALCAFGLASCDPDAGEARSHEGSPRIVSLNPCLDAILLEVADPRQILALSHFSMSPQSSSIPQDVASQYDVTGGTVEEVLALEPDLVLASSFLAPATRAAFDDLGVRVETFGSPTTVEESIAQIAEISELTGGKADGERLGAEIVDSVSAGANGTQKSAVLWQPGGIVPGEHQLISELLRVAGFSSHSAKLGLGQADYLSLEQVVATPPDVLLVSGQSRAQQHPALADSDALVADFDPALLYCGGPTIPRAMARLREIHGQAS